MEPQTFRAPTTQAALELVQNELGPEAIILSVRQVPGGAAWETWKRPEVEILAMPSSVGIPSRNGQEKSFQETDMGNTAGSSFPAQPKWMSKANQSSSTSPEVQAYLTQLAAQIASTKTTQPPLSRKTSRTDTETSKPQIPPALVKVRSDMLNQEVHPDLIKEILTRFSETASPKIYQDEARLRTVLRKQIETYFRVLRIERAKAGMSPTARVIFVIGASGSGKTSFCARLATSMIQQHQKSVTWICADTIRTGAIAQTQAYTDALGLQPLFAYTPADLRDALEQTTSSDIILVDTPARNPYEPDEVIELSAYLTEAPKRVTFLTLPASAKESDLRQSVAAFSLFKINGFVFTKVDETRHYGNLLNLVWKTKIPVAYYCDGTHIIQNLHPADASHFAELILPEG